MNAAESTGSLRGVRVLDLSRVLAGPLCAQMLADHGAEVIKIEAPSGDDTRGWGPPFAGGTAAYYTGINRNKDNICLNLATAQGQRVLGELMAGADVVVENFNAGTLAKWGYPDEVIAERFPALVHCRITGFGTDGPMGGTPGYDAILQAYGGLMSTNGEAEGPPLRVGVPLVDMVTGLHAFAGVLLALHERRDTGRGQVVDCALLDTAVSLLHPHSAAWLASGAAPQRSGSAHPSIAPYDSFAARDGLIFISGGNDRQFRALVEVLGMPELAGDPRFATNADRVRNVARLRELLAARIAESDRRELGESLRVRGVPATPVHEVGEALTDPQVLHREMVVERDDYRGIGIPIKLTRTPGEVRVAPRELGADTRRVLARLGYPDDEITALAESGAVRDGA
ncbi:CaiB/BaiF CoA transferase family protein [Saccharopolyspora griseoalba]|uniref:CaiB/BaiF CoA transferase family protein n=1 Tax=Saccharopolyspora griseoalba TaxID=1431848 RepID=A0ABW2LNS9_9PSEU